ncbi:hypothetical protein LBMAG42_27940 [Deltaproteobacteria bacterium]|nr:hypothetical protein LBMAG42_27940 [Deltaproteobacteria bacterium]
MKHLSLPLVLLLSGCDGCTPDDTIPERLTDISADATGIFVSDGSGVGSANVTVMLTNAVGAAVPGGAIEVSSSGTLAGSSVEGDAHGYATAVVSSELPGAFPVTAVSGAFTATGTAFTTTMPDVQTAFSAWLSGGEDTPVAHAGAGVAMVADNEVWWAPASGGARVRVISLANPVRGVRAATIDTDGVGDLLVWSDDQAIVLRGRAEGGLAFGGGWTSTAGSIRAFVVQDLDEDTIADALLVVGDADSSSIVWLTGDGQGAWAPAAVLDQDYAVFGASAEDIDEDGMAEVSLLTGDGLLRRFAWLGEDGWQAASAADATLGIAEGATMLSNLDADGDLKPDVLVAGPRTDGTGYSAYVVGNGGGIEVIYSLTSNVEPIAGLAVSVADGDGDGLQDVFMATPTALLRASWSVDAGTFGVDSLAGAPFSFSLDTADVDGDAVPDAVTSKAVAVLLPGVMGEDADDFDWRVATPFSGLFDINLVGDPWVGDFNADGVVDVVSFVTNGVPNLQAFYGVAASGETAETLRSARAVPFLETDLTLDLAVCESDAWVLLTTGTGTVARHYRIDGFGGLTELGEVSVSGAFIVCGAFANGVAAVVDAAGDVVWVDDTGGMIPETGAGAWGDVAAADRDGDGLDELVGCTGACTIAVGDFDGDGLDDAAWSDATDTTVSIAGAEATLGLAGQVSAADADGDGVADVLVQNEGALAVWRGLGGVPGVPFVSFMARDTRGRGFAGDLDGDAIPDMFWLGDERDDTDGADWTGTLLYAK